MKALLTSDWHETPFAEKKFETQKVSLGEKIIQWLGGTGKEKIMQLMVKTIKDLAIKTVIHNGDLQENSKNEQGIVTDDDLASARSIIDKFEEETGAKVWINAGNHELGYHKSAQPLASDPDGGMSLVSVANFLKLAQAEGLYCSFSLGGYRLVFIPYLVTERFGKFFGVEKGKAKILDALMYDLHQEKKVILFLHDPDSLTNERLINLIRSYKQDIPLIFCGHYHAQATLRIVKWLTRIFSWKSLFVFRWMLRLIVMIFFDSEKSRRVQKHYSEKVFVPKLMRELDVQIIPAPGGMLGFGGGFLVLDMETLEVTKYP